MDFDLIRVVAPWLAMMSATIPRERRCIQTGRKVLRNVLLSRDCLPRILSSPSVGHSRSARTGIQPLPQDVQAAQALLCRLLDRTIDITGNHQSHLHSASCLTYQFSDFVMDLG